MIERRRIEFLIRERKLKIRKRDIPRVRSLLESAKNNADVVRKIPITNENATLVFRELYESIRQIGDAMWWSLSYEPTASHEVSMEILEKTEIRESVKLHKLDRFRKTRNNANYRGYRITLEEAKEIVSFWNSCAGELIRKIESSVK